MRVTESGSSRRGGVHGDGQPAVSSAVGSGVELRPPDSFHAFQVYDTPDAISWNYKRAMTIKYYLSPNVLAVFLSFLCSSNHWGSEWVPLAKHGRLGSWSPPHRIDALSWRGEQTPMRVDSCSN